MKLDLGCGKKKREGFVGVDCRAFEGVDLVVDLATEQWPWADDSVDEAFSSHMLEHLDPKGRAHFVNELCRVLKKGGKATIAVPYWASCRAYGDPTHAWPPITEMWPYYLNREWRDREAPHVDLYECDFDSSWGYTLAPSILARNLEFQQFAVNHYKEAATDLTMTLTKR